MSTPSDMYGPGSQQRHRTMQTVSSSTPRDATGVIGSIYLNGSTTHEIASPIRYSGTPAGQDSRYAWANSQQQELQLSRNDAEVKVLDWAYATASGYAREIRSGHRPPLSSIVVDLAVSQGACNGCKTRQQALTNDLQGLFPGAQVRVMANYSAPQPAAPGRGTSVYGYTQAEPRASAAGAHMNPGSSANHYYQYTHRPGGSAGVSSAGRVRPQAAAPQWRSDADSPQVTPSPPSSSPTAEQELKNAQRGVQAAENVAERWRLAVNDAQTKLDNETASHTRIFVAACERLAKANPMRQGTSQAAYMSHIRAMAESQTAVYRTPVTTAAAELTNRQTGLANAQTQVAAAKAELTRVQQRQAAGAASYGAASSSATTQQPRR